MTNVQCITPIAKLHLETFYFVILDYEQVISNVFSQRKEKD